MFEHNDAATDGTAMLNLNWGPDHPVFGHGGGLVYGTITSIAAPVHNFRTGMALSLLTHAGVVNMPPEVDEGQVPTLVFVTAENAPADLYLWIYRYLKENDTGTALVDVDPDVARRYVRRIIGGNGWAVRILSVEPSLTDVAGLTALLLNEVAGGFTPGLVVVDPGECIGSGDDAGIETLKEFVSQHRPAVVVTEPLYRRGHGEGANPESPSVQNTPFHHAAERCIVQRLERGGKTSTLHLMDHRQEGFVAGSLLLNEAGAPRMVERPL